MCLAVSGLKRSLAAAYPAEGGDARIAHAGARWLVRILCLTPAAVAAEDLGHWTATRLSPRLPAIERRLVEIGQELSALPALSDLDALGSHGFHSNFTVESEVNWFEISWPHARRIDGIAVLPTRMTTQSGERSNYGFPSRLRIEATLPGRAGRIVLAELPDAHLRERRGAPAFFQVPATDVLGLRFLPVDLPTLPGKNVRFFSLSELMVFEGERNIAREGTLSAPFSIDAETGWNLRYLVDEQSPLGPPELPQPGPSLGWHADISESADQAAWAVIDLGKEQRIDGVRLVAARGDAPVKGPGFGFPVRFAIQVAQGGIAPTDDPLWQTAWETGDRDYPNPGYNRVTLRFEPLHARHVRLHVTRRHAPDPLTLPRVLLSEFEVLDGGTNLALGKTVYSSDEIPSRPHDAKRFWTVAGLTDGRSSTGRLIPPRQWVRDLSLRFERELEQSALTMERDRILARTRAFLLGSAFAALFAVVLGLVVWQMRLRLAARRRMAELRRGISSDLHDEVGSNLATISLLAEIAPATGAGPLLGDISRLSRESSQSLRDIVDLTLAPDRARKPLPERLREIAALMLKDHEWTFSDAPMPDLDLEQRRNLIFFLKEALHNILRHAAAQHVTIAITCHGGQVCLTIRDDGQGLPPGEATPLRTLRQRADSLRGTLDIASGPAEGTSLTLRFPTLAPPRP